MALRTHGFQAHRADLGRQQPGDLALFPKGAVGSDPNQLVRMLLAGLGDGTIGRFVGLVDGRHNAGAVDACPAAFLEHIADLEVDSRLAVDRRSRRSTMRQVPPAGSGTEQHVAVHHAHWGTCLPLLLMSLSRFPPRTMACCSLGMFKVDMALRILKASRRASQSGASLPKHIFSG